MNGRPWTKRDDATLVRRYPNEPTAKIAADLGRSDRAVYMRADALGLKKSPAYLATPAAGRIRPGANMGGKARFTKGHTPWNKGIPFNPGGRSTETRFKAGHLGGRAAALKKPVGTERLSKEGYLERKIHDGLPMQSRWRAVHLIEWEAVNGPLPPGHALIFRNGDRSDRRLENLQLITRRELMQRNSYHNRYPKDVALVIQLRGALNRKIRNRTREESHG